MAEKSFHLDIVTPARTVYSGDVQSFSAPGVVGSFQVLFQHAPMLSSIGIGEVKITETSGAKLHLATGGGFVEVKNNKVILLAESAENASEINAARAEKSKARAEERLAKHYKFIDIPRAQASLARSLNRIKIASKK